MKTQVIPFGRVCTCWRITLQDGTELGFTDNTQDLTIDGVVYEASSGYTPSAIQNKYDLSVSNLETAGAVDSEAITAEALRAGAFDFAEVVIFEVDYTQPEAAQTILLSGRLGEVSYSRDTFTAELRSLTQQLQQTIVEQFTPTCRAKFGDARCKMDAAAWTDAATIAGIVNATELVLSVTPELMAKPADYYGGGLIEFISGANAGQRMELSGSTGADLSLSLPMPYPVAVGDEVKITVGCRKRWEEDCRAKFDNGLNFRGEPHVPGVDAIVRGGLDVYS